MSRRELQEEADTNSVRGRQRAPLARIGPRLVRFPVSDRGLSATDFVRDLGLRLLPALACLLQFLAQGHPFANKPKLSGGQAC
jgi:hypothetical protein